MNVLTLGLVSLMCIRSCCGFTSSFHHVIRSPRGPAIAARRLLTLGGRCDGRSLAASTAGPTDPSRATVDKAAGSTLGVRSPRRKRVLSGIQPSGSLHLGNYLGNSTSTYIWSVLTSQTDPLFRRIEAMGARSR